MATTALRVDRVLAAWPETANDRFKQTYGTWLWGGIIVATFLHFALLRFFPPISAPDISFGVSEITAIDLPPEVEVPPPPEQIVRPAVPVVARGPVEENITIAPTTFEENPVDRLPPPAAASPAHLGERPVFTPYTVAPRLRNREGAVEVVRKHYPPILQKAGIGGIVVVWAFIDSTGVVRNCEIHTSGGVRLLDEAALAAVRELEFVPALNYDQHVPAWVSLPITFRVETRGRR